MPVELQGPYNILSHVQVEQLASVASTRCDISAFGLISKPRDHERLGRINSGPITQSATRNATARTRARDPVKVFATMASFEFELDGRFPVARRPKYQAPISVSEPPRLSIATFSPT